MVTEADPITDNWYQHLDKGQSFHVVAVDEAKGLIEIQYFDGNLEEIEYAQWYEMELEPVEEPENWSGALDIAELDDLGNSVTDTAPDDWRAPFREIKASDSETDSSGEEAIQDDWGEGVSPEQPWEGEL